jgi:hypothetical protein
MKIMEVVVTKIPWGGTNFLSDQNLNYYTFFHKYVVLFIFLLVGRALGIGVLQFALD